MTESTPKYAVVDNDFEPVQSTPEAETPAETPPEAAPTPDATPESVVTPEPTPEPQPEPVAQSEPAPVELTKEKALEFLGLTPEHEKIIEAAKTNTLKDYLQIATMDYDSMEPLDLLRIEFDKEYSQLNKQERDDLWNYKLESVYNITGDPEADKYAMLEIRNKANTIRSGLKAEQANFKFPTIPDKTEAQNQELAQKEQQLKDHILSHADLRQIEASKSLKIGEGEESYTLEIPFDVKKAVLEENLMAEFWKQENGQPQFDAQKFVLAKALLKDPQGFVQKFINHGKTLQEKKNFEELNNPAPQDASGIASGRPKYAVIS